MNQLAHALRTALTWLVEEKVARTLAGTAVSVAAGLGLLVLALALAGRHAGSAIAEYIVVVALFWVSLGLLGVVSHLGASRPAAARSRRRTANGRAASVKRRKPKT